MGRFRQLAAAWLIVLLAGGQAVAAVCEAACVAPVETRESSASAATHATEHHHSTAAPTRTAGQQTAAAHHRSTGGQATAFDQVPADRLLALGCCEQSARPRALVTASRLDAEVMLKSPSATLPAVPTFASFARDRAGRPHGPPPGDRSPARTAFVLRI